MKVGPLLEVDLDRGIELGPTELLDRPGLAHLPPAPDDRRLAAIRRLPQSEVVLDETLQRYATFKNQAIFLIDAFKK